MLIGRSYFTKVEPTIANLPQRVTIMSNENQPNNDNSVNIIYHLTKELLDSQTKQKDSIENKASVLIAFTAGFFGLLMAGYNTINTFPMISQIFILIGLAFLSVSVLFSIIAGWVQKYPVSPNPEILSQNYLNKPEQETKLQIISSWISVWSDKKNILEHKANCLRAAFFLQTIGFVLFGISLVLSILE